MSNPLRTLAEHGQSVWLDSIRRGLIDQGDFERMIERDDLRGVTSNPAIFEKAISGSCDYRGALTTLIRDGETDPERLYEALALEDIRRAADVFRPVHERTGGRDGFVSLEVSPHLSGDTERTCAEARRLWRAIDRPNVMIKVPATPEGIPAIETLLGEGINVNVTLLFAREAYARVLEAHLAALERRAELGEPLEGLASVASFFVSRIDSAIEREIETRLEAGVPPEQAARLHALEGQVAIANARLAYRHFREVLDSARWRALAEQGAQPQRLLWASTGTKNPALSDVHYVETLIGPDTVTTLPPATYDAFREHGRAQRSIDTGLEEAEAVLEELAAFGVAMEDITNEVLDQGVRLFVEAYDRLIAAVDELRRGAFARQDSASHHLPEALEARVVATLDRWQRDGNTARIWARDATLWTGDGENEWLGWLCATEAQEDAGERYAPLAELARKAGFEHVLLLGMGGSSLAPEVLARSFGQQEGFPALQVLDSTDPDELRAAEAGLDLTRTLVIVASKSGGTLEPNILADYFWVRLAERVGSEAVGRHFVAITDPGSALERRAQEFGFRAVHHGVASIGGRYSALSPFGLVPAGLMGLDVGRLLARADEIAQACSACAPAAENPGVTLGVVLGEAARAGRNKLTVIASPPIASFGAWLEQLLAESTGKAGQAIIPVDGERLGPASTYGEDRLFAYLRLEDAPDPEQDAAIERLVEAGRPVVRIRLRDRYDLAGEMFRWEFATAVAGSLMGINPFDQPDVEASKVATRELTERVERDGALPAEEPFHVEEGPGTLAFFADEANAQAMQEATGTPANAGALLRAHLGRLVPGDYFALLAYLPREGVYHAELQALRHVVRDATGVATCLGYGPRFLHSTGQAYKGGPNQGVFLQITREGRDEPAVPGSALTFDTVQRAQARGDFHVLAERGRRALHVALRGDAAAGLRRLRELVEEAMPCESR